MKEQKSAPVLERARRRNIKTAELFDKLRYAGLGALGGTILDNIKTLAIVSLAVALTAGGISDLSKKLAKNKLKRIDNIYNRGKSSAAPEQTT